MRQQSLVLSISFAVICLALLGFSIYFTFQAKPSQSAGVGSQASLLPLREQAIQDAIKNGRKDYSFSVQGPFFTQL